MQRDKPPDICQRPSSVVIPRGGEEGFFSQTRSLYPMGAARYLPPVMQSTTARGGGWPWLASSH